ncbi:MAG: class I SAM-dependent methyltransferase [Chloroflexi bacterium]|nr:class I SAM-dependent methyltransferase [Chloroflexota bacterium]
MRAGPSGSPGIEASKGHGMTSSTPDYSLGFTDELLASLTRNTADSSASYLLPYLRPGLRVLDFGCGPGTITVGLARVVAPGTVHGIDMEESQVELARSLAAETGVDNAVFDVADVLDLPFEDDYFDLAFCHNVLMHVPDTRAALAEVRRVMKPGGIIGCREMISRSSFTHPDYGVLQHAWRIFEDVLETDNGHPNIGKDLKRQLLAAGFNSVKATASFDFYAAPADVAFVHAFATGWFLSPEMIDAAIQYGASTEAESARISEAYDRWKDDPGAFCALAFGEAIAAKH